MDLENSAVYLTWQASIASLGDESAALAECPNWDLVNELHVAIDELEGATGLEAVILSGEGRAFSTGIDLTALAMGDLGIEWFLRFDEALRRLETLPVLTVARMHGYALGGGLMVGLACDLRVASADCRFGFPAVLEELVPGMATYRLPRFIGLGRAKRLVLTGEIIDAEAALAMGLVDWVVSSGDLFAATARVVRETTRSSTCVRRRARELMLSSYKSDFAEAMANYLDRQQQCLESDEHKRAMRGYLQRREGRLPSAQ